MKFFDEWRKQTMALRDNPRRLASSAGALGKKYSKSGSFAASAHCHKLAPNYKRPLMRTTKLGLG